MICAGCKKPMGNGYHVRESTVLDATGRERVLDWHIPCAPAHFVLPDWAKRLPPARPPAESEG